MEAMRERWTDDRMDDLVQRVDTGFAQVDARFAEVHEDIAALRVDNKELRREMATLDHGLRQGTATLGRDLRIEMNHLATREELRTEIKAVRSEMREGFDRLIAAMIAVVVSLIAS